jgi:hypothetical protein
MYVYTTNQTMHILRIRLYWYLRNRWVFYKRSHSLGISIFGMVCRKILSLLIIVENFYNTGSFIVYILFNMKLAYEVHLSNVLLL